MTTTSEPEILRHGAYVCLRVAPARRAAAADLPVPELARRLELDGEYHAAAGHPRAAIGFVRRAAATPGEIVDDALLDADAVVHVAAPVAEPVDALCRELARRFEPLGAAHVLRGVVRPPSYTGGAMFAYAYARQRAQTAGDLMPSAFLLPLAKTRAWWDKDWMERHTYFLPRHDLDGRRTHEGHALAAEAGIAALMRRTYRAVAGPYDFLTYFECADADVPTFHAVCGALRDVERNPEWRFVREGPMWHGRRVATWRELF